MNWLPILHRVDGIAFGADGHGSAGLSCLGLDAFRLQGVSLQHGTFHGEQDDGGRFESIYLRPTNSSAGDQVRRNHTVQYVAFPDYRFFTLRAEAPEKYESCADVDLGRWIHMRIEVAGQRAALYLDGNSRPA